MNVHNPRSSLIPLKIYEIPGFYNESSIQNSSLQLSKLNQKLSGIHDEIHVIFYFFKSDDLIMFKEEEKELIKSIPNQKNLKLIYIFTNSTPNTPKNKIMEKINDFIQKFLGTLKFDKGYDLFMKMKAHENNCIFVNFYPKDNPYGIKEIYIKLLNILKETNLYKSYNKTFFNNPEFRNFLKEEADKRKIRAKQILLDNSICNKVQGVPKEFNLVVQKCAIFYVANFFGLEIVNLIKKNEFELFENINNIIKGDNFEIEDYADNWNNNKNKFISNSRKRVNVYYILIFKGSGLTIGDYFPYEFCEKFIDKLYNYFLENISSLSGSILLAAEYLEKQIKKLS